MGPRGLRIFLTSALLSRENRLTRLKPDKKWHSSTPIQIELSEGYVSVWSCLFTGDIVPGRLRKLPLIHLQGRALYTCGDKQMAQKVRRLKKRQTVGELWKSTSIFKLSQMQPLTLTAGWNGLSFWEREQANSNIQYNTFERNKNIDLEDRK